MKQRRGRARFARQIAAPMFVSCALFACSRNGDKTPAAGSAAASNRALAPIAPPPSVPAPVASGVPIDPSIVSRVVNPDGKVAYSGPVGAVEGRIVASGDPPSERPEVVAKIPDSCKEARTFYGKLFREGPGRTLADVLVGVTGYHEYVPARAPAQRFVAKNCAFETRTIALTYGQRLEVVSGDREAYVTELLGEKTHVQIIATPGGDVPSTHYPTRAGRFVLVDNIKLFMTAEVLVLKFATVDVTGIDGRYRIEGIPPGRLKLSAMLPATGATVARDISVEAGKTLTVDLEIPFDAKAYRQAMAAQSGDAGAEDAKAPALKPSAKAPPPKP